MDEQRLRLRYENGLSTSLGENAVRRVNKRVRQLLLCHSAQEKSEIVLALLRDQNTLRDMVLVQQLRHKKVQGHNLTEFSRTQNELRHQLEAELKEKTELYEQLMTKLPKLQTKMESAVSTMKPVAVCEAEIGEIEKEEKELDARIRRQGRDLAQWKELGLAVEEYLNGVVLMGRLGGGLTSPNSAADELEPKIKKLVTWKILNDG